MRWSDWTWSQIWLYICADLRSMPPSREALRHSGGDSLLFTSAMVTLYLEVELSSDRRPGTEQNRSVGFTTHVPPAHKDKTFVTRRFGMMWHSSLSCMCATHCNLSAQLCKFGKSVNCKAVLQSSVVKLKIKFILFIFFQNAKFSYLSTPVLKIFIR